MLKVANNMRSTNCSNTLRNMHNNARENITRTRAERKVGYFFVAHPVLTISKILTFTYIGQKFHFKNCFCINILNIT
jgi:hypothetical protein